MVRRVRIKDHWAEQRIFTVRSVVAGVLVAVLLLTVAGALLKEPPPLIRAAQTTPGGVPQRSQPQCQFADALRNGSLQAFSQSTRKHR